jgi:importin subunit beta-1
MGKIFEALEVPLSTVKENAMQCLVELARLQYDSIEFYFQKIAIATNQAANSED